MILWDFSDLEPIELKIIWGIWGERGELFWVCDGIMYERDEPLSGLSGDPILVEFVSLTRKAPEDDTFILKAYRT